jgi:hypothetical protein
MSTACHLLAGAGHQWPGQNLPAVYAQAGDRLELEQGLDGGTQASGGVCEEKGSRETHPSQGTFARGHTREQKKEKERKE